MIIQAVIACIVAPAYLLTNDRQSGCRNRFAIAELSWRTGRYSPSPARGRPRRNRYYVGCASFFWYAGPILLGCAVTARRHKKATAQCAIAPTSIRPSPKCRSANRSPSVIEPVCGVPNGNWKMASRDWPRKNPGFGPEILKIRRQRPDGCGLTRGNDGVSRAPGNHGLETPLAGCPGRIRTSPRPISNRSLPNRTSHAGWIVRPGKDHSMIGQAGNQP
jgi:hypothetical protein